MERKRERKRRKEFGSWSSVQSSSFAHFFPASFGSILVPVVVAFGREVAMLKMIGIQKHAAMAWGVSTRELVGGGLRQLGSFAGGSSSSDGTSIRWRRRQHWQQIAMRPSPRCVTFSTSVAGMSQPSGALPYGKVYVNYTFYKGKGALSLRPKKPVFEVIEAGGVTVSREGSLFLEFAPSVGPKTYDWSRKQIISLSVLELGRLLELQAGESVEFFHDPNMGKSEQGKVRKSLRIEPIPDKTGYFFNLTVANKIVGFEDRQMVPIMKAEFAVMRSLMNYLIPHLLGWQVFVDPSQLDDSMFGGEQGMTAGAVGVSEWAK